MNGGVDAPGEQRVIDLLGEEAGAADPGERDVADPVAGRPEDHDLDRQVWRGGRERAADVLGLPPRQLAAA